MLTRRAPPPDAPAPIGIKVGDVVRCGRYQAKVTSLSGAYATIFRRKNVAQGRTIKRVRIDSLTRIG
jgi:hypothetical protein